MLFPSENLICCAACEAFDAGLYSLAATEDDGVTLIRKDAIKRAEIVDAEMGWEAFTALGKMAAIWDAAQEDEGRNVLRRRQILEWARINPADADRFLAACCIVRKAKGDDHVHFLEPAGHDKYILVGNPEELDRIEQHRAKSSAGGKASVESRKAKLGSADPRANREPREPNPEPSPEQPREPTAEVNVNTSALALASELESPSAQVLSLSPADLSVGSEWMDFALQETPWRVGKPGMTQTAFAESVARVRRSTGLNEDGIRAVLAFVRADDFWRKNALSPAGLLRKSDKDGLRKIDNILLRMKAAPSREQKMINAAREWAES